MVDPRKLHPQKSTGQGVVRVGALKRYMADKDQTAASKFGLLLAEYHASYVEPRLQELEAPLLVRWWIRLVRSLRSILELYGVEWPEETPEPVFTEEEKKEALDRVTRERESRIITDLDGE